MVPISVDNQNPGAEHTRLQRQSVLVFRSGMVPQPADCTTQHIAVTLSTPQENPGFWETIGNFNEKDIAVGGILYPTLSGVAINQLGVYRGAVLPCSLLRAPSPLARASSRHPPGWDALAVAYSIFIRHLKR